MTLQEAILFEIYDGMQGRPVMKLPELLREAHEVLQQNELRALRERYRREGKNTGAL